MLHQSGIEQAMISGAEVERVVSKKRNLVGEVRIALTMNDSTKAKSLLRYHTDPGFAYIPHLMKSMEVYEQHRERHPTLADYVPTLLEMFAGIDSRLAESSEQMSPHSK